MDKNTKETSKMIRRMAKVQRLTNPIGIHYYPNGDKYDGEWKNNNKEGQG